MNDKVKKQQPETVAEGPGKILKRARERINLSSQDMADKMKLRKSLVEDIEQDNYDVNISLTFIRGYLKLYAKHVHESEADILFAFESLSTQKKEPAKLQSFSRRVANQANDDKLMLVTYLIVTVVIALVVIWWFQQSSTDTASESSASNNPETLSRQVEAKKVLPSEETPAADIKTAISPILAESMPIDEASISSSEEQLEPIKEPQSINQQLTGSENEDTSNIVTSMTDVIETTVMQTAAPVELIFEFSGDCWMNLADATGENIAYGVKIKGRVMPVSGIPPFSVTLGAPEVVKISYAGEDVDMSFLPSGQIAKFNLPPSE